MNLEVGQVLIAKDECLIYGKATLIVGKEYPINGISSWFITVESEYYKRLYFSLFKKGSPYYLDYFEIKHSNPTKIES